MVSKTIRRALASAVLNALIATTPALGMQIKADHSTGEWHIGAIGDVVHGDYERFVAVAKQIPANEPVIVALASKGGIVTDAINIGTYIHEHGWATVVLPNNVCVSACASIWIGGAIRIMSWTAHIGFHQETDIDRFGHPLGPGAEGNAILGGYYAKMGLSQAAIAFAVHSDFHEMTWLTAANARYFGIDFVFAEELIGERK